MVKLFKCSFTWEGTFFMDFNISKKITLQWLHSGFLLVYFFITFYQYLFILIELTIKNNLSIKQSHSILNLQSKDDFFLHFSKHQTKRQFGVP